jgi:predicted AAA+ superfamily ATPase
MTLTEPGYRPRLLDAVLADDLETFGAVSVEGPKWCGKTWACLNQAESVFYLMDPLGGFANRQLALLDPAAALAGARPHLVDEWQEVPQLWDAVRFQVDRSQSTGSFLLTGSTKPADGAPEHSGTGRIAVRRMRPMTLFESGDSSGEISLAALAAGGQVSPAKGGLTLDRLIELACRGGWPGALGLNVRRGQALAASYLDRLALADMSTADGVEHDPAKTRPFLSALARHSATLVSGPTLRKDMAQAFGAPVADSTVSAYLGSLRKLYVLEDIPPWAPRLRSRKAIRQAPKRLLADPSLIVAGLGATPEALKRDLETFGLVFEALALRDLLVFADRLGAQLRHYRDDSGMEVDAVLALPDARWGAVEVKLGFNQVDKAARSLLELARQVTAAGGAPPAFLAVVVGVGAVAQTRPDGVHVIGADQLGP